MHSVPDAQVLRQPLRDWPALARRLVADGILEAAAVVDGGLEVRDSSGRNDNAILSPRDGPSLFVKRGPAAEREAAVCRRLRGVPGLAPYLPAPPLADPERTTLVLAVETGARDLWTHQLAEERFSKDVAHCVGRALGLLHRGTRLRAPRHAPGHAPWALEVHRPRVESLRELTPATLSLVRLLQRQHPLGARLDDLRAGWRLGALTHNDVKWPNILLVPGDADVPIRLVNWEHAGDGDPAWDIGSALAGYLTFWLYSIRGFPGATAADLAAAARFPLGSMRPAIGACWHGYLEGADLGRRESAELLRRSTALCAARLIGTAYEETAGRNALSPFASLHLQVAANILDDPGQAAHRLLGLGPMARR